MGKQNHRQYRFVAALSLVLSLGLVGTAAATTQSVSPHYMVTESQFGPGSSLRQCSSTYCAKTSAGDTTVGRASSSNYSAQFGSNTSDVPVLEVEVDGGNQDMGVLDTDKTGTAVDTIKVRTYLSSGYVLQITGAPPSQGSHQLKTFGSPVTSQPGAEQFGINLVDNSAPDIGADPVQMPSSEFGHIGHVISGDDSIDGSNPNTDGGYYATANMFMYHDGDIVAKSANDAGNVNGETDYTMSMIINVSNVTPGGRYTGVYSAVAVPVF